MITWLKQTFRDAILTCVINRVWPTQPAMGCGPNGRHLWNGVDLLQPHSVVRATSVSRFAVDSNTNTVSHFVLVQSLIGHRNFCSFGSIQMIEKNHIALWKWYHDNWCIKALLTLSVKEPRSSFFSSLKEILPFFSVNWRLTSQLPESTLALCAPFKKSCVDESVG